MSFDTLLESPILTTAEQEHIAIKLSDPIIRKYLKLLAIEDTKELLGFPVFDKSAEEVVRVHATVQGKLLVLSTLLSIGELTPLQQTIKEATK